MPVQCVLSAFLQPNNVLLVRFPWDNIVPFAKTRVLLVPAAAVAAGANGLGLTFSTDEFSGGKVEGHENDGRGHAYFCRIRTSSSPPSMRSNRQRHFENWISQPAPDISSYFYGPSRPPLCSFLFAQCGGKLGQRQFRGQTG